MMQNVGRAWNAAKLSKNMAARQMTDTRPKPQQSARSSTFMRDFMLKRVVENQNLSVLPRPGLLPNPYPCALTAHDAEMHAQLLVRWAVVGDDVGAGGDCGKHGVSVDPGYPAQNAQRVGAEGFHLIQVKVVQLGAETE